jgi:hypothetical protein
LISQIFDQRPLLESWTSIPNIKHVDQYVTLSDFRAEGHVTREVSHVVGAMLDSIAGCWAIDAILP